MNKHGLQLVWFFAGLAALSLIITWSIYMGNVWQRDNPVNGHVNVIPPSVLDEHAKMMLTPLGRVLSLVDKNMEMIEDIHKREKHYLEMIEDLNVRLHRTEYLLDTVMRKTGVTEPRCAGTVFPPELLPMPREDK